MGVAAALSVRISANVSDLEKQFAGLEKKFGAIGSQLTSVGSKLTQGITVPLVAAAGVALKFAADFEKSTTKLVTLSGIAEKDMQKLKQAVIDLAPTVAIGPNALSEALLVVTSTGFKGAEAMKILELAAMSSSIGMGDTKDVARALTAAISAYGSENLTAAQAADVLHATVVAGGAEAAELAGEMGRVVGVAASLGVSFQEVGAFIATYTRLGLSAAEATTGLSGVLNTILNPSREARDALAGMGISAQGLRAAIADQGLGATLTELIGRLKGNADATGALFGNVRALAGVMGTAGTQAAAYKANLDNIKGSTGGLNTAFEQTKKTASFMWSQFLAESEKLAITLGVQLLPAMTKILHAAMPLMHVVVGLVQAFGQLPQPVQTAVLGFLALAAALGPIIFAVGKVVTAFGALMTAARLAGGAATTAFGAVSLSTAGTVTGVVALAAGFALLAVKIRESIKEMGLWATLRTGFINAAAGGAFGGIAANVFGPGGGGRPRSRSKGDINLPFEGKPDDQALEALGLSKADWNKLFGTGGVGGDSKKKKERMNPFAGTELFKDADQAMKDIAEIGGVTKLTADETKRLNDILSDALDKYGALGRVAPAALVDAWAATMPRPEIIKGLTNFMDWKKGLDLGTKVEAPIPPVFGPGVTPGLGGLGMPGTVTPIQVDQLMVSPFREAFRNFGQELPDLIFGALMAGGIGAMVGTLASALGEAFSGRFAEALEAVGGQFSQLSGGNQALGLAGMGIAAGTGGFMLGQKFGKGKGALAGAASGALAGTMIMPGIGTAIGAGIGALMGFFGGRSKEKKEKAAMEEDRQKLLEQFGGMEKLKDLAKDLGVNIDLAFTTKKPQEFQAAVESLNTALEKQKATIEAIGQIVEGVNTRAANITSQGDLDVVGAGAVAGFALQMQEGATAMQAFQALTPAITAMKDAMASGNFTLTESASRLLEIGVILDQDAVQFTNLGASGQIMQAMLQGNIRDGALFAAVATDIGTQIQTVIDRGVPMAQVFALAQPQLQALWEAQKKWGFAVDDTTQALLTEAEAQGFVGTAMKSVNAQILEVLVAIGKVLGADIPAALAGLPAAAQAAADGMQNAFDGVKGPNIQAPWVGDLPTSDPTPDDVTTMMNIRAGEVPAMASLNGAIQPAGSGGTAIVEVDGRVLAEVVVPSIPGVVQRYGLA